MAIKKTVTFRGGPKSGDKITVQDPPLQYMKLAMPEWAVYEYVDGEYVLLYDGITARFWRNPVRSPFIPL